MKRLFTALLTCLVSTGSFAQCFGSSSIKNCYDDNGNNYNVTKIGNRTYVDGYNSRTGSNWSSETYKIGNTIYQDGTSADGGSWNQTIRSIGNYTYYDGTDSNGDSYSYSCNSYGCY